MPNVDLQLAAELLNLARMSYSDNPGVGTQVTSGDDSALIVPFREGHAIAFRGTVGPSFTNLAQAKRCATEWMSNDDCILVASDHVGERVHQGFLNSFLALWPQIQPHVSGEIWMTGHSRGGALATLAATRISTVATYTFGSPRVGDQAWADEYNLWNQNHFRFENGSDIVPHCVPTPALASCLLWLPFGRLEHYQHVGKLCYLTGSGIRHDDSDALWFEREASLLVAGDSLIEQHLSGSYLAAIQALM
jgi:hypothetical protein